VELKNDQGTTEIIKQRTPEEILGAAFGELTDETKSKLGINYGVEVTDLTNGKFISAGIKKGFIILTANDERILSPDEFLKNVETALKRDPDERGLFIRGFNPGTKKMEYYAIDLNE
jgi:S1-C subfamily serine protease